MNEQGILSLVKLGNKHNLEIPKILQKKINSF